jgi:hypothetical protein
MPDFLDELDLAPEDRERLRSLGAVDASALRAMYRAAPADFARYVGAATDHVIAQLDAILPSDADEPTAPARPLGGRLEAAPQALPPPPVDLARRDALFAELQTWRAMPASPERDTAIADLEDQLNALLDGAVT